MLLSMLLFNAYTAFALLATSLLWLAHRKDRNR